MPGRALSAASRAPRRRRACAHACVDRGRCISWGLHAVPRGACVGSDPSSVGGSPRGGSRGAVTAVGDEALTPMPPGEQAGLAQEPALSAEGSRGCTFAGRGRVLGGWGRSSRGGEGKRPRRVKRWAWRRPRPRHSSGPWSPRRADVVRQEIVNDCQPRAPQRLSEECHLHPHFRDEAPEAHGGRLAHSAGGGRGGGPGPGGAPPDPPG